MELPRMTVVLASASPRRRMLMERLGVPFEVVEAPDDIEEAVKGDARPGDVIEHAEQRARAKAEYVSALRPEALVVAADTIVSLDGREYGKPASLDEARKFLRELSGRANQVSTAVALAREGRVIQADCSLSRVHFRTLSDEVIERYLACVNPLDKAGAYAIQNHGDMIVAGFEGDYDTIVGLPVELLKSMLMKVHEQVV